MIGLLIVAALALGFLAAVVAEAWQQHRDACAQEAHTAQAMREEKDAPSYHVVSLSNGRTLCLPAATMTERTPRSFEPDEEARAAVAEAEAIVREARSRG